ncbi:MAG TPA: hypothetical protein VG291_01760 [Xanthobacteraceae bacterium]|nr:hypothetical protein [Xanthobacteraceae bacterium]
MRHVFVIVVSLLVPLAAEAANIEVKQVDGAAPLVMIDGDLELGDIEVFHGKVSTLSKATVAFRSDGGSLLAGIRIGMLIRVKNFTTIVPDAAQCASACAVAWLGGAHRFLGAGSKVGFHAAYVQKAGAATESGPGNAVLGAYLDQIGLPEDAIVYITQAAPSSMKWLNMEEAAQHGIDVALLPAPDAPAPLDSSVAANQEQPQTSLAGRATGLVLALAAHWSEPNTETLGALDELYADKVFYHGKVTPRQAVLLEKRRFAERWPHRSYKVRLHSVTASCNAASEVCRVQGIMDRELANPATNTKSHDETAFDYSIARSGEALKISAETSSVSKLADPSESNPLTSVQRGLARLLARVSRIRQVSPGAPDGQIRPSASIPR